MKRKRGRLLRVSGQVSPRTPGTGKHKLCTQSPGSRITATQTPDPAAHSRCASCTVPHNFCLVLCLQGSCSVQLKSDQLLLRWWLVMLTHSMGIPQRIKMVFSAEIGLYCLLHSAEVDLPFPLLLFPHSKLTVSLRIHANTEISAKTTEHLTVCKSSVISKN